MRILVVQHVPFERAGLIESWAVEHGHTIHVCQMYKAEPLPAPAEVDLHVSMGGPMGVSDADRIPFLASEMSLMRDVLAGGGRVFGVCLGAQLLAAALGARVFRNTHREIGWMPVQKAGSHKLTDTLPDSLQVLHWHGDTFDLPQGSVHLLRSEACANQAFVAGNRALGLQFHLEMTELSLGEIIENCREDLASDTYVHSESQILADAPRYAATCRQVLFGLLDRFVAD